MMQGRYRQPKNEDAFEDFCLELLREHWSLPTLQRYGHRGERQYGVDLYDTGGSSPLRGVQCKHHDATKTLPPKEVQAEVDKARGFPETIGEFYILTTAKKSTRGQQKVREINKAHLCSGLFKVQLLTWDDVERIIDDCPGAQDFLGVQAPEATRRLLRQELKPLHDDIRAQSEDALGNELDEIKAGIEDAPVDLAEFRLDRMRARSWDRMSLRARFRWCTLRADCHLRRGNESETARLLLEAKTHQPDDEKAIVNEINAYGLLGEYDRAHSLARKASVAAPHSAVLYAALIRSAPTDDEARSLFDSRPAFLADAVEVWAAAAVRTETARPDDVEPMVREAVRIAQDDARPWLALSGLLLRSELEKLEPGTPPATAGVLLARIDEARECCTRVLELAKGGNPRLLVTALLRRATAFRFLGNRDDAEEDIRQARRLAPAEPQVLLSYARMEEDAGRLDAAVETLRQLAMRSGDEEARCFLALALWNRNESEDRTEAINLLQTLSLAGFPHREVAAELLIEGLLLQRRVEVAREWLAGAQSVIEPCLAETLAARVETAGSNREAVEAHIGAAMGALTERTPKATRRKLVRVLLDAARQADALAVLEKLVVPGQADDDVRQFVSVAGQLGRHKVVLDACAAARTTGTMDPFLVGWEVSLLGRYDPEAALRVLTEFLPQDPKPARTRLNIAHIALRLGRTEDAVEQLAFLPTVEEASAEEGAGVVAILNKLGRTEPALAYAYDLLRRHFRDPHAHRAYRDTMLFREDRSPPTPPEEVAPGCAVCLEERGLPPVWYVIEDSVATAEHVEHELVPESPLAQRMTSKRVGDEVVLSEGPGLRRTAVVRYIQSKRVYRLQDVMNQWQYRFPDLQEMWMIQLAESEDESKLDFTPLFDMAEQHRRQSTDAEGYYKANRIPINALGSMLNKSELYALAHLAESRDLSVRCCLGNIQEYQDATEAFKTASAVVLDVTALATLLLLDRPNVLRCLGTRAIVTHTTLEAVKQFVADVQARKRRLGSLGATEDGPVLYTSSEAEDEQSATKAASFLATVSESCRVVGCPGLAAVSHEDRELFAEVVGDSVLESGIIAAEPGTLLWSDDGVASHYLQEKFGTKRIWTQAVLRWLNEEGLLPDNDYTDATVRLVSFKYEFTSVNPAIMLQAGKLAEWDSTRAPLRQAIEYLALDMVDPAPTAFLAAKLVADCYVDAPLVEKKQALLIAVAESLVKRQKADETIRRFVAALGPAFGVNMLGRDDAVQTLGAWLGEYSRRPR